MRFICGVRQPDSVVEWELNKRTSMVGAPKIVTQITGTWFFGGIFALLCATSLTSDITAVLVSASALGMSLIGGCLARSGRQHFAVLVLSFIVLVAGIKIFGRTVEAKYSCEGRDSGMSADIVF
jgi:hypothetical protein